MNKLLNSMTKVLKENKFELTMIIVLVLIGLLWHCHSTNNKGKRVEFMEQVDMQEDEQPTNEVDTEYVEETKAPEEDDMDYWKTFKKETLSPIDFTPTPRQTKLGMECAGKDSAFISSNLLPKTDLSDEGPSDELKGLNLLDTPEFIGVDTISNTNRNASYDLRPQPPNQRKEYPWMNSTIDPNPYAKKELA